MTSQVSGDDRLREAIVAALADRDRSYPGQPIPTFTRAHYDAIADQVLALPELAALRAKDVGATRRVGRVAHR